SGRVSSPDGFASLAAEAEARAPCPGSRRHQAQGGIEVNPGRPSSKAMDEAKDLLRSMSLSRQAFALYERGHPNRGQAVAEPVSTSCERPPCEWRTESRPTSRGPDGSPTRWPTRSSPIPQPRCC